MDKNSMIVVTGAAGFIGSCMVGYLNQLGFDNLVIVDEFSRMDKVPNLADKKFSQKIDRDLFFPWLQQEIPPVAFFFHLGARTDTTEFDYSIHEKLNLKYSQSVWKYCTEKAIPLVYASSAATYGAGEYGYKDDHQLAERLQPLNPYGISKNEFDKWALRESSTPPHWHGLKFFNVYGPNEYHKGRMASVIFHSFNQVKQNGYVNLFRSHRPDFTDGQQLRDFIYMKDLVKVCAWFMDQHPSSGLYNLGTGKARSFYDLALATFMGLNQIPDIRFIDMPVDIRDKYQYFTEADMQKLKNAGYTDSFYTLEEGVGDYVGNYLSPNKYY
jgi:ADP-L-glycero-D-manno-heptose 6-epimerase